MEFNLAEMFFVHFTFHFLTCHYNILYSYFYPMGSHPNCIKHLFDIALIFTLIMRDSIQNRFYLFFISQDMDFFFVFNKIGLVI